MYRTDSRYTGLGAGNIQRPFALDPKISFISPIQSVAQCDNSVSIAGCQLVLSL